MSFMSSVEMANFSMVGTMLPPAKTSRLALCDVVAFTSTTCALLGCMVENIPFSNSIPIQKEREKRVARLYNDNNINMGTPPRSSAGKTDPLETGVSFVPTITCQHVPVAMQEKILLG